MGCWALGWRLVSEPMLINVGGLPSFYLLPPNSRSVLGFRQLSASYLCPGSVWDPAATPRQEPEGLQSPLEPPACPLRPSSGEPGQHPSSSGL